jgi:GNAT superfamily N-acetyltransferase
MSRPPIAVQPVGEANAGDTLGFLIGWVVEGGEDAARAYLAGHVEPAGSSFIARCGCEVAGYATIVWESAYAGFRERRIPLVHQIIVAEPFRRQRVATRLMDAAEQLARDRGVSTLGITVGLFDEYGPAQRMYAQRGYVPDGRGACQGHRPLREGAQVTMNHELIMWLTKDLGD